MIKNKLKEWFKRYALAELTGILFALIFSNLSMFFFKNTIIAGFIGTWMDNLGFYGIIVHRDLNKRKRNKKLNFLDYLKQLRNMIVEFGPAEYLDSFIIRPLYYSFLPYVIADYSLAIFIGAILAGITYYIPAIISYEFRKKIFMD
ncbi:hypothetical protein HYU07_06470 [Candidatus Woesearchaeota archaeon]|nr:hypothetical protein [Candidatus Woesearchaeota archaeon]